LSAHSFATFSRFIERELGIKMTPQKRIMLQGRLQRRMRALHIESFDQYGQLLFDNAQGADELIHFIDAVTTNKTDFFREAAHFEHLIARVLPDHPAGRRFQAWCAGCSTGEEPYTLAMLLAEELKPRAATLTGTFAGTFAILATDISTRVLEVARRGIYGADRVRPVPPTLRLRYLRDSRDRSRGLVRVAPQLRERVSFHRLNFMQADYNVSDVFDAIFFRNVAIYFDRPTQQAVITKLCRSLRPGGYLYIGMSESLTGLDVPVAQIGPAVYRKG
jgi:chemotaxis protein methyltransferase CheR